MSTPPSNSQQCQATRRDGQPCTAGAGAAGRCIGHRPEAAAARSNGGKGRATAARAAKHGPPALAGIGVDLADARAAVVGCRGCDGPISEWEKAVFGDSENGPRAGGNGAGRPRTPPRPVKAAPGRPGAAVGPSDADRRAYAVRVWESATWIPKSPSHPARRWLWNRQGADKPGPSLWWESLIPLPPVVHFLEALPADGWPFGGNPWPGPALVVLLAPPSAWVSAWPRIPQPHAVQLVFVDSEGRPRDPGKRTIGDSAGCCAIIGNPAPMPNLDGLIVCEGLADGLALASRTWEAVLVTAGRPQDSGPVFEHADGWHAVKVHADADGPGRLAALDTVRALAQRGVDAKPVTLGGFKDAAALAESGQAPLVEPCPIRRRRGRPGRRMVGGRLPEVGGPKTRGLVLWRPWGSSGSARPH